MSAPAWTPWVYLDTGEVFEQSDEGEGFADFNKIVASLPEPDERVGSLIAAAPDHALILWAMCVQDGRWEEWSEGKGEFCYAGLRHATALDEFGSPILTANLRARLTQDRDQSFARARGDQP